METEERLEREVKGIWVPIEIWESKDLSLQEMRLLMEIDSFTQKGKDCFLSNEKMAEILKIKSETQASAVLNSLIKGGYVEQTRFDGRRRYVRSCLGFCIGRQGYDTFIRQPYENVIRQGYENPEHTNNKITSNKITNKERNIKKENDYSIVPSQLVDIVREWEAYKREKKETYTPRGFSAMVAKLVKYSGGDAEVARSIIEDAMSNNYKGFFEPKQKRIMNNNTCGVKHLDESWKSREVRALSSEEEEGLLAFQRMIGEA